MPFFSDQNVIPRCEDLAGFRRFENFIQTATGDPGHSSLSPLEAGKLEKSGRKIDKTDVVLNDSPGIGNSRRPHDCQWHVVGILVFLALDSGKRHSVVGGYDDQGVFEQIAFLQRLQHFREMAVKVLNLKGIIQHVRPDGIVVRPHFGNPVNLIERFAANAEGGAKLIGSMRFGRPIPEAERLAFFPRIEKGRKIGGVINRRHAFRWRRGLEFLEIRSGQLPLDSFRIRRHAGTPTLAGVSDFVAAALERLHEPQKFGREDVHVIGGLLKLPAVSPGQDGRSRGGALGIGGVGPAEENPARCDPIETGRFNPFATVGSKVLPAGIVCDAEKDIGSFLTLRDGRKEKNG